MQVLKGVVNARDLGGLPVVKDIDFRRDEEKKFDLRKIIVMAAFNE